MIASGYNYATGGVTNEYTIDFANGVGSFGGQYILCCSDRKRPPWAEYRHSKMRALLWLRRRRELRFVVAFDMLIRSEADCSFRKRQDTY